MAIKTEYASPSSAQTQNRGVYFGGWTSAIDILNSNNLRATGTGDTAGLDYLIASGFGFSIPSNAQVTKLYVKVEGYRSGIGDTDVTYETSLSLWALLTPDAVGTFTSATSETTIEVTKSFTPGSGPTPTQVNGSGFSIGISSDDVLDLYIDSVQVAIEYEVPDAGLFFANNF